MKLQKVISAIWIARRYHGRDERKRRLFLARRVSVVACYSHSAALIDRNLEVTIYMLREKEIRLKEMAVSGHRGNVHQTKYTQMR